MKMTPTELRDYCLAIDPRELTNDKVRSLCRENGVSPDAPELNDIFKMLITPLPEPENTEWGMSLSCLMKTEFPDTPPLVEGLIYPGLTILTGAAKIGKSWAALQLVTALDQGGAYLGSLKAERTDVLYCALEDTPRRIQQRILKQGGAVNFNRSRVETERRRPEDLKEFLQTHSNFRVVIIDTLQKMLSIDDMNDYSKTVKGISVLKDIADTLGIAVVAIHHTRKGANGDGDHMESALGSTGINATADTTLTIGRKRGMKEATLGSVDWIREKR